MKYKINMINNILFTICTNTRTQRKWKNIIYQRQTIISFIKYVNKKNNSIHEHTHTYTNTTIIISFTTSFPNSISQGSGLSILKNPINCPDCGENDSYSVFINATVI